MGRTGFGLILSAIGLAAGISAVEAPALLAAPGDAGNTPPLMIATQGSFEAGGRVEGEAATASISCDHGHVEYQIPVAPRAVSLFLWHSSSAAVWQRRWDGGEGFQSIWLRRGYPVYLWDGPRVGRANWGCEEQRYRPWVGRDQASFIAWRLGAKYKQWFDGVQFPTDDPEAWNQAVRARYDEFDTVANARLEAAAAAAAIERIGRVVLVTNSAGGFRALLTALRTDNVVGIVAYETPGFVFPEGEGPRLEEGRFGPVYVSPDEFAKLARIPIQLVWGDNIDKSKSWADSRRLGQQFVDLVNAHGGKAEMLDLPDMGLKGNTHIPFADLNNVAVADLLGAFLNRHGLDHRAEGEESETGH